MYIQKKGETKELEYLKLDSGTEKYVITTATKDYRGIKHLINYLKAHPEDKDWIRPFLKTAQAREIALQKSLEQADPKELNSEELDKERKECDEFSKQLKIFAEQLNKIETAEKLPANETPS